MFQVCCVAGRVLWCCAGLRQDRPSRQEEKVTQFYLFFTGAPRYSVKVLLFVFVGCVCPGVVCVSGRGGGRRKRKRDSTFRSGIIYKHI